MKARSSVNKLNRKHLHFDAMRMSNEAQNDFITRSGWYYRAYEELAQMHETFFFACLLIILPCPLIYNVMNQ
jgi:hypothetical protein